jgi:hypothetical protein
MHKIWRLAILLALITASCRIEVNLDLVLEEDGSGTYTSEVGYDDEIQQAASGFIDIGELLSAFDFGVPDAAATERIDGDMTYSVVASSFTDAADLANAIQTSIAENPFERFQLEVTEEGATVDLAIQIPEDTANQLADASALAERLEAAIVIRVTMPGQVVSSNADRTIGDNELIWDIDFTDTNVVVQAESTFVEEGFPFWIIILVLLVAGALGAWWYWSKRQQDAAIARIEAARETA